MRNLLQLYPQVLQEKLMLKAIFSGIGVGLVLSVITGPVFFALLKTSIEKGFKAGSALAFGVLVSDIFYVGVTYFSTTIVNFEETWQPIIAAIGSIILVGIGIYYLVRKTTINYEEVSNVRTTGYMIKGFAMNFFNPFVFFYWLSIATIFTLKDKYDEFQMTAFFIATLAAIFSSDVLKSYLASRWRHLISDRLFMWLNRIAGSAILIFGIRMVLKIFIFKA